MIPWMRMRGNPVALVPIIGALVAAGVIYARIFTRGGLGTGEDVAHLLIVLALLQTALVLDLFLQFAVARRRVHSITPNSSAEYVLRAGDSVYFPADAPHSYANRGDEPCEYHVAALVMRPRVGRAH